MKPLLLLLCGLPAVGAAQALSPSQALPPPRALTRADTAQAVYRLFLDRRDGAGGG